LSGLSLRVVEDTVFLLMGFQEDKHGVQVLLAKDNMVNQKLAVRLLEKRGYTVRVVGDGQSAVEAHETGQFDIVLMDV
jgi:two-component system sensor histidine kinase/response regulator